MKLYKIIIPTVLLLFFNSCAKKSETSYDSKQDQFTFIVLDKNAVGDFFKNNKELTIKNVELKKMILDSLYNQTDTKILATLKFEKYDFSKNTKKPNSDEYKLSQSVLEATYFENQEDYFSGSLEYYFYFKCLPGEFKHKWTQASLGHFQFNSAFFSILRDDSPELDKIIYGDIVNHDENLKKIFQEPLIFNEITPEIAKRIKQTILSNEKFNDKSFEQDKLNFLLFLDKTIEKEWRMILIDWN